MKPIPSSQFWTTERLDPQLYRNSWDLRFRTHDPRATITHLTPEEYRALYLEVFKVTAPAQPKRILDYGCGTGLLIPVVEELWPGSMYDGADVSPDMIHFCKRQWNGQGKLFWLVPESLDYWKEFEANEPESDKFSFDFIVCHSVLTHITLEDAKDLLKTLHGLLEDGGRASISIVHDFSIETIGGDWGKVLYNRLFFQSMLFDAGFAYQGEFYSSITQQIFFGVSKCQKSAS